MWIDRRAQRRDLQGDARRRAIEVLQQELGRLDLVLLELGEELRRDDHGCDPDAAVRRAAAATRRRDQIVGELRDLSVEKKGPEEGAATGGSVRRLLERFWAH